MRKLLLVVMLLSLAMVVLAACSPSAEKPAVSPAATVAAVQTQPTASTAPASNINAEELVNQRCSECHTFARVRNAAKTQDEWTATVKRMQGKGLKITAEEFDVIVAFLSENYK